MRTRYLLAAVALTMACAGVVRAEPVRLQDVPAKAKWLVHVDVDAMRSSTVIEKLWDECMKEKKLSECFDKMAEECGTDVRKDLHGLTLYGTKLVPGQGVLIVRAKVDKERLLQKAKKAQGHETMKHDDHTIHTWVERGCKKGELVKKAGAFYEDDVLVIASSVDLLKEALGVLDDESKGLEKSDEGLAAEVPEGTIFLVRAVNLSDSHAAKKHALCAHLSRVDYAEGEHEGQWRARLAITTKDEKTAEQVEAIAKGLLAAGQVHLESYPKTQELLDRVEISRDNQTVEARFEAPAEDVAATMPEACKLVKKCIGKHMAKHKADGYGKKRDGKQCDDKKSDGKKRDGKKCDKAGTREKRSKKDK